MIKELTPIQYNNKTYYYRNELLKFKGVYKKFNFNRCKFDSKGSILTVPKEDRYLIAQQLIAHGVEYQSAGRLTIVDEQFAIDFLTTGHKKKDITIISNVIEETSVTKPQVLPFEFENFPINVFIKEGEYYFIAAEVCKVLDIKNSRDAVSKLDDDEKLLIEGKENIVVFTDDANTVRLNLITYPGLLRLAMSSRKAKNFQRWVLHDVLDSIRKKGYYALPGVNPVSTPTNLRELYESNNCLLLKDNTYHDFLQRMVMKIVGQIPFLHWEEEISIVNTHNPDDAKTRRFDLVEIQAGDRVIIWELHTQPIDQEKVIKTIIDKAYLKLAREYYRGKKVYLTFTSPEGISDEALLLVNEMKDVRFVDYRDLILHLFRLFRKFTPSKSQWRLQKEEQQLKDVIGDRPDIPLDISNCFKGVTRRKNGITFRSSCCVNNKRIHILTTTCPIEAALSYDLYLRDHKVDKSSNFPQLETSQLREMLGHRLNQASPKV